MNLEEKRKEIESLCQNLDESNFCFSKSMTKDSYYYIRYKEIFEYFDINNENHYSALIDYLKEHQKEPELYTLDEIKNGIDKLANDPPYKDWIIINAEIIKESISKYMKPYKK